MPSRITLAQPDEHQAVYGSEHRLDHVSPDPLALGAEQAIAQPDELAVQGGAVAKQEKQGQQGEPEEDQPMDDLAADFSSRFRRNPRSRCRPSSSSAAFGSLKLARHHSSSG